MAPNEDEYTDDYPIGGMVEPYDIERDKELTDKPNGSTKQ